MRRVAVWMSNVTYLGFSFLFFFPSWSGSFLPWDMRENYSSHFSKVKGGINLIADLEPFPSRVSGENRHGGEKEKDP